MIFYIAQYICEILAIDSVLAHCVVQAIGVLLYCAILGTFVTYQHEMCHAQKALEFKPNMRAVVYVFCIIRKARKKVAGNIDIYFLQLSCKTKYIKTGRFQIEDNFETFSDKEIVDTAKAGVDCTKKWSKKLILLGLVLGLPVGSFYVFLVVWLNIWLNQKNAEKRKGWSDYRAISSPSDFREHCIQSANEHTDDYDTMVEHGEECIMAK